MRCQVKLFVAGKVFTEDVHARNYDEARQVAVARNPNARVLVLIPFGFFSQLLKIRALYVLGFWFVLQFINSFLSTSSSGGGVAYAAHIGGFISGLILILFFNKRNIRNNLKKSSKNIKKKGPWEQ